MSRARKMPPDTTERPLGAAKTRRYGLSNPKLAVGDPGASGNTPNNLPCAVCDSPALAAANSMRELGAEPSEISEATGLQCADLENHFAVCRSPLPEIEDESDRLTISDQRLQLLLEDATATYHISQVNGNLVAATASLGVRLRAESEVARRLQARTERETVFGPLDPRAPASWPPPIRKLFQSWCDGLLADYQAVQQKGDSA